MTDWKAGAAPPLAGGAPSQLWTVPTVLTSIGEEEPNAAVGSQPDLMDLARTIKKEQTEAGNELRKKDGWRGPIGLGGGNNRNLLHNVRFWWRPKGGDQPLRFRYNYIRSLKNNIVV